MIKIRIMPWKRPYSGGCRRKRWILCKWNCWFRFRPPWCSRRGLRLWFSPWACLPFSTYQLNILQWSRFLWPLQRRAIRRICKKLCPMQKLNCKIWSSSQCHPYKWVLQRNNYLQSWKPRKTYTRRGLMCSECRE